MSLLTTWGYSINDVDELPNMLGADEYDEFTADKFSGDVRTTPNIGAACSAIRNYCGWHVSPSLECVLDTTFFDGRAMCAGAWLIIQLPATFVSEVKSVEIDGTAYTQFSADTNGILRVYTGARGFNPLTHIEVVYTAGVPDYMAVGLKELVAHRVTHALASSNGVQSEAAGGVSITYSANWTNSARSTALPDDNKAVIEPYRLKGVF